MKKELTNPMTPKQNNEKKCRACKHGIHTCSGCNCDCSTLTQEKWDKATSSPTPEQKESEYPGIERKLDGVRGPDADPKPQPSKEGWEDKLYHQVRHLFQIGDHIANCNKSLGKSMICYCELYHTTLKNHIRDVLSQVESETLLSEREKLIKEVEEIAYEGQYFGERKDGKVSGSHGARFILLDQVLTLLKK